MIYSENESRLYRSVRCVMVTVVRNGHGDPSSDP